jgi:putative ABC transport system ATP-binding protein
MATPPLFELADVCLEIDGTRILDHVDLTIAAGGITVLVGPSGAGKSTLLRLLDRLEVPTSGEVRFRGERVAELDPLALRRQVGMVFQTPAPFPGTVRDNLLVADPGASDDDLVEALRAARLDAAFLGRPADDLSGGEAQRMCLARTLVTRPDVLLMDEPTSALDPDARRRLERTARRLAGDGHDMVWVTHDLDQADRLADDLVVLVAGRVADDGERARYLARRDDDLDDDLDDEADDEADVLGDDAAIGDAVGTGDGVAIGDAGTGDVAGTGDEVAIGDETDAGDDRRPAGGHRG